jgi:hypothetical protein
MFQRVPQPPVQPAIRPTEAHGYWAGLIGLVLGVTCIGIGATNLTSIETTDGDAAHEAELIRAFAYGGLRHENPAPPEPPRPTGDPVYDAAAMERWQRQMAERNSSQAKLRVDTGAKAACPT